MTDAAAHPPLSPDERVKLIIALLEPLSPSDRVTVAKAIPEVGALVGALHVVAAGRAAADQADATALAWDALAPFDTEDAGRGE